MPLLPSVEAALRAQATRTVIQSVKHRARCYARQPMSLDTAYSGLSAAAPETMIAIGRHLVEVERRAPCRWFGFGGEVPLINAKAIILLGRALRRARRLQQRAPT
ncbi:hypothetical protein CU048_04425 [Beijerinckiaceae bacterium]|nr:hypothetical protein CU048_04425 [Beijerinckiaceae bacterium]